MIFGHTGFSGNWLSRYLAILGNRVFGASLHPSEHSTLFLTENPYLSGEYSCDIRNFQSVAKVLSTVEPDAVINLAAISQVLDCHARPIEAFETNALGTANVLEACFQSNSTSNIVLATTDKVYFESDGPHSESDLIWPTDPYSGSKVAAEAYVAGRVEAIRGSGKVLTVFRGGNIIGGGDWATRRLVPDIVRSWKNDCPLELRFPGAVRPWQHVLELTQAYQLGLEREQNLDEIYALNVGPQEDKTHSVLDLISLFSEFGVDISWHLGEAQYRETLPLTLRSNEVSERFGHRNLFSARTSVRITADWYVQVLSGKKTASDATCEQISNYLDVLSHKSNLPL